MPVPRSPQSMLDFRQPEEESRPACQCASNRQRMTDRTGNAPPVKTAQGWAGVPVGKKRESPPSFPKARSPPSPPQLLLVNFLSLRR